MTEENTFINKRVSIESHRATIQYAGPLIHEVTGALAAKKNELWFGIEWDDAARGKNNGTINGTLYFKPKKEGTPVSLCLEKKCNFGTDLLEAVVTRYFINQEAKEILANKEDIVDILSAKGEELKSKEINSINSFFDEDGFIYTYKSRTKRIEYVGFDKHWKKINTLDQMDEQSINDCLVKDFGPIGTLRPLIRNVWHLSLESNLLCNWEQIITLGKELPALKKLNLSYNHLVIPENFHKLGRYNTFNQKDEVIDIESDKFDTVFANLKTLVLLGMGLTWKKQQNLSYAFKGLEELLLCYNECNDFENIDDVILENFKNLKDLNLEKNGIVRKNLEGGQENDHSIEILAKFLEQKNLKIRFNQIHRFPNAENFNKQEYLNIEYGEITDPIIITDVSTCPILNNIRILKNPLAETGNSRHIRNRSIGEIRNLTTMNGSELSKFERRDCEIYYLRWVFQEYFRVYNTCHMEYLLEDFMKFANEHHKKVAIYIEMYENPYPQIVGNEELKIAIAKDITILNETAFIKVSFLHQSGSFRPQKNDT